MYLGRGEKMKVFVGMFLISLLGFLVVCYVSPQVSLKSAYSLVKLEFPDLPEFSNQSLKVLSSEEREDYIVVDVRTAEERNVSIIAGAIDNEYFERNITSYENKKIIVYCTIGYRSGFYAETLRQKGLDAYNLSEGILGWTHVNGLLINSRGQTTDEVHVYSRPWDLAVKNAVAVF